MVRAHPSILVSDLDWLKARRHQWTPELFCLDLLQLIDLEEAIENDLKQRMARSLVKALREKGETVCRPSLTKSATAYPIQDQDTIDYAVLAQDITLSLDPDDVKEAKRVVHHSLAAFYKECCALKASSATKSKPRAKPKCIVV
jgi:hypothetical protein